MSSLHPEFQPADVQRRNVRIGAVIAVAMIAILALAITRGCSDEELEVLVTAPRGQTVEEGERLRVTGVVRDSALRPQNAGDGTPNLVLATRLERVAGDTPTAGDFSGVLTDDSFEGQRVTLVGDVSRDDVGERRFLLEGPE